MCNLNDFSLCKKTSFHLVGLHSNESVSPNSNVISPGEALPLRPWPEGSMQNSCGFYLNPALHTYTSTVVSCVHLPHEMVTVPLIFHRLGKCFVPGKCNILLNFMYF